MALIASRRRRRVYGRVKVEAVQAGHDAIGGDVNSKRSPSLGGYYGQ